MSRPVSNRPQSRLWRDRRDDSLLYSIDLLWRPRGQRVRFGLVDHPTRGRVILMSTERALTALEIIAAYRYRFKIELAFKQALYTLGR